MLDALLRLSAGGKASARIDAAWWYRHFERKLNKRKK
jgi:hypothetical protein